MLTQQELNAVYMDAPEAAKRLKIGNARIRQLCLEGRFEGAVKTGRSWLIPRASVEGHERLAPWAARKSRDAALLDAFRAAAKEQTTDEEG